MEPLSYPFPAVTLNATDVQFVREKLVAAEDRWALYARRPGLLQLVEIFLQHCSPPSPGRPALEAMTHFLYVVMYFADRANPSAMAAEVDEAWKAMMQARPARSDGPAIQQVAALAGQQMKSVLAHNGGELTTVAHRLRVNLSAFIWDAPRTFVPASYDEHMDLRVQTICVMAYVRVWGVLAGLQPGNELRFAYTLERLERLSAVASALANDLRSVDRDARDGTPNAVSLLASVEGLPPAAALAEVRRRHDAAVAQLAAQLSAAHAEMADAPDARAYVDFVGSCTRGNNTSMDDLYRRYER